MPSRPLPEMIEAITDQLAPSEKRVARVMLANYPVAGLQTLVDVAKMAETSHPTVLRFIKKLGFSTYPEFQDALRREVEVQYRTPWTRTLPQTSAMVEDDGLFEPMRKALSHNFNKFMDFLPKSEMQAIAKTIHQCSGRIITIGGNMTEPTADMLFRYISLVVPNAERATIHPPHLARTLGDVGKKDIICAIHMPRYDYSIQKFCELAVNKGATLVLFTDTGHPPLANIAKYVLPAPIDVPSLFDSYIVTSMQIEILLHLMINLDPEGFKKRNNNVDNLAKFFEPGK